MVANAFLIAQLFVGQPDWARQYQTDDCDTL